MLKDSIGADFYLVIPAFREANRLPAFLRSLQHALAVAPFSTQILIVDDGSPLDEQKILRQKLSIGLTGRCRTLEPLILPENSGKGAAIMAGWRVGGANNRWLAFVDADGAISASEVVRTFRKIHEQAYEEKVYFGSRLRENGHSVSRPPLRALAGMVFRLLVRCLIDPQMRDSQCGFKVIPAARLTQIAGLMKTAGFCFDVELLSAVRFIGLNVKEIPIDWEEKRHGHVNVFYHSPIMLKELWMIRQRGHARVALRHSLESGLSPNELAENPGFPLATHGSLFPTSSR